LLVFGWWKKFRKSHGISKICSNLYTVVLTLNPAAPENGIIFALPQAVPAGQIKSFAIPQQKETVN
jgi:hypothetical protein